MLNLSFKKIKKNFFVLIILDGWGIAPVWGGNAISIANNPVFSEVFKDYPHTLLAASDGAVGLPEGSPGNSEAGHLNIGAGSIVHQDQPIIDNKIKSGSFFTNETMLKGIEHAKKNRSNIHIMGLLSKAGTHAHINHLYALLQLIKDQNYHKVFIHLFTDGRDSDSMSGIEMVSEVEYKLEALGIGQVASLIGRYYAMDRDNRWDRIGRAYRLLTCGQGKTYSSSGAIFTDSYSRGITDEFIEPAIIQTKGKTPSFIADNDSVFFFNFRADRAVEITRAFLDQTLPEMPDRQMLKNLYFTTFVMHHDIKLANHPFYPEIVTDPIAKILADKGFKQYHSAETEKYAHITYFLNGGLEKPHSGEDRLMIPSPRNIKTYDEVPEMSINEVSETFIEAINKQKYDALFLNFANPDMVGHTGNFQATVKAVEHVDFHLGKVLKAVDKNNGICFITADHGNAEQMVNPRTGSADTEHTCNPVPFIIYGSDPALKEIRLKSGGKLSNITPTILDFIGVDYKKDQKEDSLICKRDV